MAEIQAAIVAWYEKERRDLPWRRTRVPYAIWVSEVMLQQTRVDTVIPYYERFLARFPDLATLAAAELDEVFAAWQGLGYYRRARQLHEAARHVASELAGELPHTVEDLRRLRGIGRYTAGAIASIGHGKRAAVVDGNVARVLARLFDLPEDVKTSAGQRRLWQLAEELVPAARPGDFNQGLMELGATVCLPGAQARCERCPLAPHCLALRSDRVAELPLMGKAARPRSLALAAAVVAAPAGRLLLARRAEKGLYGGLWEPPMSETLEGLASLLPAVKLSEKTRFVHRLTHRRLEVTVYAGRAPRALALRARGLAAAKHYGELAWSLPEERALSTLARRVIGAAEERV